MSKSVDNSESHKTVLWSDRELFAAIDAYLYMLRSGISGANYDHRQLVEFLTSGPLKNRNRASIRYRLRNLSFVFQKRGWPILPRYTPASQIGARVEQRVNQILDRYPPYALSFLENSTSEKKKPDRLEALSKLKTLEDCLYEFDGSPSAIGHNHPPEPIDQDVAFPIDLREAKKLTALLIEQFEKGDSEDLQIRDEPKRLEEIRFELWSWLGQRLTKFVDAVLIASAPIFIIKAYNLLGLLTEALAATARFLGGAI